ncbi:putative endonuclease [Clostridium amylolyticum]|uniref:Putative endonuclease n=1 Tax=Clostridium amylolyticum TaxID=1121298 RepID=A0A1M6LK40_9CLOT|nr:GIY-YIG nuclease family protein [Clostridium amylolyticum]SHJ71566.1 putative endonuclease [Clostridium amylolyticum]
MCYVYILECGDNTLYTGWTNNLNKRIQTHAEGKGAKYTRGRLPVKLVYFEKFEDKVSAQKREYAIKKLSKENKLKLLNKEKAPELDY